MLNLHVAANHYYFRVRFRFFCKNYDHNVFIEKVVTYLLKKTKEKDEESETIDKIGIGSLIDLPFETRYSTLTTAQSFLLILFREK